MDKELRNRIISGNKYSRGLKGKFKSHILTLSLKLRPALMYSSESGTQTRSNNESLRGYEGKVLRRIFGPMCENGLAYKMEQ
jgi:hypothetical protein